ncbi:pilin [Methylomagnum ishizawai]|uniref:pilin n=1 Tax=Methylomagnum ishizawai TaxID=1760988 RepID=UPI001C32FC34|nr:pilin [Methylomagnum ishizawai]BBL74321.1 hypothetical protein MishRS11D_14190 [Methylomagnum ishizawai]
MGLTSWGLCLIKVLIEIFIGLLAVAAAPLAVQAVFQSKSRIGRLAQTIAGIALVVGFLVVWGDTGRDPLQWVYCWLNPGAYSCQDTDMAAAPPPNGIPQPDGPIRSQIQEALLLGAPGKTAVTEVYASLGQFPRDNPAAGLPDPEQLIGNYTTGIAVEDGAIHIALGNRADPAINGKTISLRPARVGDNPASPLSWLCGYAEPVRGMVAQGANRTSVPALYLPVECRP